MRDRLLQIANSHGTPAFAYDLQVLRRQIRRLLDVFPAGQLRYSLKANPSLGLCRIISAAGFGADVSSLGELLIALAADFPPARICVSGPHKSPELLARIGQLDGLTISVDSLTELSHLASVASNCRVVLRLRWDLDDTSSVTDRFGIHIDELHKCREHLSRLKFGGFHVFTGTQRLQPSAIVQNFRRACTLAQKGADILGRCVENFNFGAGFGVPYRGQEQELDLPRLAADMKVVADRVSPTAVVFELGRYIVAQCGWYLTSVVAHQSIRRADAVVVDGGTHQRADLCDVGLSAGAFPPLLLNARDTPLCPVWVLGSLCMPSDVLAKEVVLPNLRVGDVLAFPNAGAYGLTASPLSFLCHPVPAEIAFDNDSIVLLRDRSAPDTVLRQQRDVRLS